ncbi:hypothetical protein V2J09_023152 [Rumex salicifolius]
MEQLVNFIIRPPRAEYNPENDLLDEEFLLKGKWYQRKDIEVKNSREDVLQCSHYIPTVSPEEKALPCVIYCHGNRADASEAAIILLPLNITVFTLDFSGSGLSGGEHVTLGWNERDDLRAVVNYLRSDGNVSMIGLWGRSMGAVTSLMYGAEDPSIAGMVLDSPFSDLVDLMMELVDTYKVRIPKFTVKFAIQYMRRAVQKKAKFDITELNTIKVAKSSFVPVLLGHAVDDDFIQPHHSDRIFEAYAGDKNIIKFDGDHNSPRPQFYFDSISIFFSNVLQPPDDGIGGNFMDPVHMHDYIDKVSSTNIFYSGKEAETSGTQDPIEQLRSKRPMSRMEVPPTLGEEQPDSKEETTKNSSPQSSTGMISFELSNGVPYGPHVPMSIDDDQYVEYPLDYQPDFPCDEEDEERMIMIAMMESLKDFGVSQPPKEDILLCNGSNSPESSNKSVTETLPTEKSCNSPVNTDATSYLAVGMDKSTPKGNLLTESITRVDPGDANVAPAPLNATKPSDSETADGTKATLTVEKSPAGHNIIEGLFKRWDKNFFKSNR